MKLAALFSDHAVLQQGISVPVWGCTKPRTRIRVSVGTTTAESFSDPRGEFLVRLPPMPAGGPHTLTAQTVDGTDRATRQDIWIGEVWVCSGQSNMQWIMKDTDFKPEPADIPGLRVFTVTNLALPVRQTDLNDAWQVAAPSTIDRFSAVAFHLGLRIHRELNVAVGLINTSWGGTRVEAWTSRNELMQHPQTARHVEQHELAVAASAYWDRIGKCDPTDPEQRLSFDAQFYPADPGNQGESLGWAAPHFNPDAWPTLRIPGTWQEQGHNYSGVFWFRRTIDLPETWTGKDLLLSIGAVDKHDITYFNGERVGATGTGFDQSVWNAPRRYQIPARLVKRTGNVIAVRAYSFLYNGGMIGPRHDLFLKPVDAPDSLPLAGDWHAQCEHNFGPVAPGGILGPGNPNSPAILFDSMIWPLIPYAIRGAAWYQGESNTDNPAPYGRQLATMIRDWRHAWAQGDFPFLTVQLANHTNAANFDPASTWALVREGQLQSLSLPATGLAVTIDIGDATDIHPRNKHDVGDRLARWALAHVYDKPVVPSGPLYAGMTLEGNAIRLRFTQVGTGLVAKDGELKTFVIAAEDRVFKPASARIEGNTIRVHNPAIEQPYAVRYAWANNPEGCNLYNAEGLPASPFRTDAW